MQFLVSMSPSLPPQTLRAGFSCLPALGLGLLLLHTTGCHSETSAGPAGPPAASATAVKIATATVQPIVDYREYTGRTAAVDSVEIRARVSGYLLQSPRSKGSATDIKVDEGELVDEGDLLFVIDPQPYELALKQSTGSLEAAQARLTQATQDLARSQELYERNTLSRAEYDAAVAAVADLNGQIANLKATVARNQLDLDYTRVKSPISGLLGRTLVTNGNLVVADTTILATVVSADPIYVDFDVDEQSVLDYRSRMLDGKVRNARDSQIPIRIGLANEDGFPHEGYIDFVNNVTDPKTGNTRVRGRFENASGILSPGLFARIRVPFTAEYEAVLIPTTAIGMDQQGRYVMVVGDDNKAARRSVELGEIVDDMTVVSSGVTAGEQVVTSGLQKIRPGSDVRIESAQTPATGPAGNS